MQGSKFEMKAHFVKFFQHCHTNSFAVWAYTMYDLVLTHD
jgi:hypothetical protein